MKHIAFPLFFLQLLIRISLCIMSSFRKRLRLFYRFEGEQVYEFPCIFVNDKQMNIQNIKPNQYETTPSNTCHHPISMLGWLVGKGQTNHHYQWIDHWKKCKENHIFRRKSNDYLCRWQQTDREYGTDSALFYLFYEWRH